MTHIIWTNYNLNLEDWKADLEAEHPELNEDERYELMYEINDDYLDDERMELNKFLPDSIIVIADLGLWDGRRTAYREISSGNIRDCLYSDCDYVTWYVDESGDLRCDAAHHDGTNNYLYRVWKNSATEKQRENFRSKLYNGTADTLELERLTDCLTDPIGPYIADIYGWDIKTNSSEEVA